MKKSVRIITVLLAMAMVLSASLSAFAAPSLKISKKNAAITVGKKITLKVKSGGKTVKAKWKSSNNKVATVSNKGVVRGKKAGRAKITATVGKKTIKCAIAVKDKVVGKSYKPVSKSLTGTVSFSGSTSVYPSIAALTEAFKKQYAKVKINITNVTGSGAGLIDAKAGKVSFGMRSSEWASSDASSSPNITPYQIAMDGVAIVVNKSNTSVSNMKIDEIQSVYEGKTQYGLSDPVSREAGSGTRTCFEDIMKSYASNKKAPSYKGGEIASSTVAVENIVSKNTHAIGYMSLGAVNASVKKISVEGVDANETNVLSGSYKFSRPFLLLRKTDKKLSTVEKEFLKFVYSTQGQNIIDKCNFIKLSNAQIASQLAKIK